MPVPFAQRPKGGRQPFPRLPYDVHGQLSALASTKLYAAPKPVPKIYTLAGCDDLGGNAPTDSHLSVSKVAAIPTPEPGRLARERLWVTVTHITSRASADSALKQTAPNQTGMSCPPLG